MSYEGPSIATTSPVYTGPRVLSYPFATEGDLTHVVAEQQYIVQAESYIAPALNTTITVGAATLYLVGDYNHSVIDSGCIEFTRRWASIPAQRSVPGGTFAFTFPGMMPSAGGAQKTITAATFAANSSTFTSTAHGFIAGDLILLTFTVTTAVSRYSFPVFISVLAAPTADTFTTRFTPGTGATFVSGTAQKFVPARNPRTVPATTIIQYDYALPGVTSGISTVFDFQAFPEFRVVGASGEEGVENIVSIGTDPTQAAYLTSISNGDLLVVESGVSVLSGAILERRTVYVRAQ
jgi:hypothetical protein